MALEGLLGKKLGMVQTFEGTGNVLELLEPGPAR